MQSFAFIASQKWNLIGNSDEIFHFIRIVQRNYCNWTSFIHTAYIDTQHTYIHTYTHLINLHYNDTYDTLCAPYETLIGHIYHSSNMNLTIKVDNMMIITAAAHKHNVYTTSIKVSFLVLFARDERVCECVFVCVNKGNICDSMKQYSGLFCVSFPWWINPPYFCFFSSYFVRIIKLTRIIWHRYELCRIQRNESNRALEHTGRQAASKQYTKSVCMYVLLLGDFLSISKRQWCLLLNGRPVCCVFLHEQREHQNML